MYIKQIAKRKPVNLIKIKKMVFFHPNRKFDIMIKTCVCSKIALRIIFFQFTVADGDAFFDRENTINTGHRR